MAYDLHSLDLFRSVAETGSIAATAARHGIVASAVSKRLSWLEAEAGTALLLRHRRGVELTEAGRLLLAHAEALARQVAVMQADLADQANGARGTIRLCANTSAITQFLPEDLAEFMRLNPGLTIRMSEMESVQVIETVRAGAADLGIFSGYTDAPDVRVLPYRRDTLVVCAPQAHPLAARSSVRLGDLDGQKFVALQPRSSLQEFINKRARDLGFALRTVVEVKSFDAVRRMVQARLGVAILPLGAVEAYLDDESIAMVPIEEPWATRDLLIALRDGAALSPQAEALLRILQG